MNPTKIHPYFPQNFPHLSHSTLHPILSTQVQKHTRSINKSDLDSVKFLIDNRETVFYADTLTRLVSKGSPESRIFVITNKYVYNIERRKKSFLSFQLCSTPSFNFVLKKKFDLGHIIAITISTTLSEEFIIHFSEGLSYRFRGQEKRNNMIQALLDAHFSTNQEPILFCFREETTFKTIEPILKHQGSQTNQHLNDKIQVTQELAQKGFLYIFANRKNLLEEMCWNSSPVKGVPCRPESSPATTASGFLESPSSGSQISGNHISNPSSDGFVPQFSFYVPEIQTQILSSSQQPLIDQNVCVPYSLSMSESCYVHKKTENSNDFPGYTNDELVEIQHYLLMNNPVQNVQIHTNFEKHTGNSEAELPTPSWL